MIVVVVCVLCVSLLACAAGVTIFVVQNGGFQGALDALSGGGKPGSKWKPTQGTCDNNTGVTNAGGKCVQLEVESGDLGTSKGGSYMFKECPEGEYVDTMAAGYDEGNQELKWLAARCSGGQVWSRGKSAPSGLSGIDNKTGKIASGTDFDNRYWRDPADPGWDQVTYIKQITANGNVKPKGAGIVRAFGPKKGSNGYEMFGVNDNSKKQSDILDKDKEQWRCDVNGAAPAGKRYAIVGVGASTGNAVDRFKIKCRMFDTA